MKNFFPVLLLCIFFSNCNGQNKTTTGNKNSTSSTSDLHKISKPENGWQDASIGCSIKDKKGNLWFGSNGQGVYRYDGKIFTHFSENDGLYDNIVYSILEDKSGNIWIGSKTGLSKYDPNGMDDKKFIHVPIIVTINLANLQKNTTNKNPLYKNGVWCMLLDNIGTIWFGTDDGVFCYNGSGFTNLIDRNDITNRDSLNMKAIVSMIQDSKGNIWFASNLGEGLIRFDGKNLSSLTHKNFPWTQSIAEDKNGNIWFSVIGKGMCRYDGKEIITNFFKEKQPGGLYIIWNDKEHNIWFCDPYNNIPVLYYTGTETINFTAENKLIDYKLAPVIEDNDGNIWFATASMGLYRYDARLTDSVGQGKNFSKFSE